MTIRELKSQLANTINNSGLAIDVIELVLENFLSEVRLATDRAYAEEMKKLEQETQEEVDADESTES